MARHRVLYLSLALEVMNFFERFHHLTGESRALFSSTNNHFLHIILRRVKSHGRGLHNKVEYAGYSVRGTHTLEYADNLLQRLSDGSPAVLLGFTIFDQSKPITPLITTVVYSFKWPHPSVSAMGQENVIKKIVDAENALREEGKKA